jgi:hypothetical protein
MHETLTRKLNGVDLDNCYSLHSFCFDAIDFLFMFNYLSYSKY